MYRLELVSLCLSIATFIVSPSTTSEALKEGIIVSTAEASLVISDRDGKNVEEHAVATNAKITLNGQACLLAKLKPGDSVQVQPNDDGKLVTITATRADLPRRSDSLGSSG